MDANPRFRPSAALDEDFTRWLAAYSELLQKHKDEVFRHLTGWLEYAGRKFRLAQPRKTLGRPPDERVTEATRLRAQGIPWKNIYPRIGAVDWEAQQRLREAVGARARRRRHKPRVSRQIPPPLS